MTVNELQAAFERHSDEYLEFDRVENPRSHRADLHAFLLLDEAVPSMHDIVAAAEHDVIYLDTPMEDLASAATDELVRDLVRCGVRYDEEANGLAMFT